MSVIRRFSWKNGSVIGSGRRRFSTARASPRSFGSRARIRSSEASTADICATVCGLGSCGGTSSALPQAIEKQRVNAAPARRRAWTLTICQPPSLRAYPRIGTRAPRVEVRFRVVPCGSCFRDSNVDPTAERLGWLPLGAGVAFGNGNLEQPAARQPKNPTSILSGLRD